MKKTWLLPALALAMISTGSAAAQASDCYTPPGSSQCFPTVVNIDPSTGKPSAAGAVDTVVKGQAAYRGGTATSGGVSQQLMAANTARRGWNFQNQSTGFCYIKIGAAATADNLSYRSAPGNFYETPTSHTSTGAINVLCVDTGAPFYATEW